MNILKYNSVFYEMVKAVYNVAEFTKLIFCNCIKFKVVRLKPDQPNQWLRAWVLSCWICLVVCLFNTVYNFFRQAYFDDNCCSSACLRNHTWWLLWILRHRLFMHNSYTSDKGFTFAMWKLFSDWFVLWWDPSCNIPYLSVWKLGRLFSINDFWSGI